jgi:hypothetical protein
MRGKQKQAMFAGIMLRPSRLPFPFSVGLSDKRTLIYVEYFKLEIGERLLVI